MAARGWDADDPPRRHAPLLVRAGPGTAYRLLPADGAAGNTLLVR